MLNHVVRKVLFINDQIDMSRVVSQKKYNIRYLTVGYLTVQYMSMSIGIKVTERWREMDTLFLHTHTTRDLQNRQESVRNLKKSLLF